MRVWIIQVIPWYSRGFAFQGRVIQPALFCYNKQSGRIKYNFRKVVVVQAERKLRYGPKKGHIFLGDIFYVAALIIIFLSADGMSCYRRLFYDENKAKTPQSSCAEVKWWFAPSTLKVSFPESPLVYADELVILPGFSLGKEEAKEGKLWAARSEYESIQLILLSEVDLQELSVKYVPAGANPIPSGWLDLFKVLYISTPGVARWGFPEDRPERRYPEYPDPLLPLNGDISLAGGQPVVIWIRVGVPADAASSEYTGVISLGEQ